MRVLYRRCPVWLGLACLFLFGACEGHQHGHGHGEGHGHEYGSAGSQGDGHDHSEAHPAGHDHHEGGHGHGGAAVVRLTRWSERSELFAEYGLAVAGKPVQVRAHITVLEGFRALASGRLFLELDGPEKIRAQSAAPRLPGIFELQFTAPAGEYSGHMKISGAHEDVIEGITLRVYADPGDAAQAPEMARDGEEDSDIDFLKEQQWKVPFGTAFAVGGVVQPTTDVTGSVGTPPGGAAELTAPVDGRVVPPPGGLLPPGTELRQGQLLASLAPTPASPEAAARAKLAVVEAGARAAGAEVALERARRLMADQAISRREMEDAEREAQVAGQALTSARQAQSLFAGAKTGRGAGSWRITSPIVGTLTDVNAQPGAGVARGAVLFSVVNTAELWVTARVPEQYAARLDTDRDARYRIAGLSDWLPIRISGERANAALVTVSPKVNRSTRTVDVIYALRDPDPRLRVGGLLRVGIPTGELWKGVVVPTEALVYDRGRALVYVQLDGEHFEERAVRAGPGSGAEVGIEAGLAEGERVVTRGANLVRLAGRSSGQQPHGHIH